MPEEAPNPTTEPTPSAGDPPKAPATDPPADPAPKDPKAGDPPKEKKDEPLGEAGLKALQAERESRKALESKLKNLEPLQKLAEALGEGDAGKGKSELEQLSERMGKHEKELASEREARWRAEVAHEKGLTPQQAERLTGSTRDELAKDADALLALFPAPDPKDGKKFKGAGDGGPRGNSTTPTQLTREDLKGMTAEQIVEAKGKGQLKELLGST